MTHEQKTEVKNPQPFVSADWVTSQVEVLFEELIRQQQEKVLRVARDRVPHLTGDDILNPHDFPELMTDPIFNYEEGIAAGLMAAQFALRAQILRSLKENALGNTTNSGPVFYR